MWEKIKKWWERHQAMKEERALKEMLETELLLRAYLNDNTPVISDVHEIPLLICSVYFEQKEEMTVVDFSREEDGIAHFMIFTKEPMSEYDKEHEGCDAVTTKIKNAKVFMKNYLDGSSGWCFSS